MPTFSPATMAAIVRWRADAGIHSGALLRP
jgi:hypothetical protein